MQHLQKTILLFVILAIGSVCQQPPILQGSFSFGADNPVNGSYGNLNLYWNNQFVLYAQDVGNRFSNFSFYLKPKRGINILNFVVNNTSPTPVYLDNIVIKVRGMNNQNFVVNGNFEGQGGWPQLSAYNIGTIQNQTSKWLQLTSTRNTLTQLINFDSNYNNIAAPTSSCSQGSTYLLSFDYAARVNQNIANAKTLIYKNGVSQILSATSYNKQRYVSFVCGGLSNNSVTFTKPSIISVSTLTMDNVVFTKIEAYQNLVKGGDFQTLVNFCGTYTSGSNMPSGWTWAGSLDLVAGCVTNPLWQSVVVQVGVRTFGFTF